VINEALYTISHSGVPDGGVTKDMLQNELNELYQKSDDYSELKDFYDKVTTEYDYVDDS